eukprot:8238539-Pyramimonas_sp.AAC.1
METAVRLRSVPSERRGTKDTPPGAHRMPECTGASSRPPWLRIKLQRREPRWNLSQNGYGFGGRCQDVSD